MHRWKFHKVLWPLKEQKYLRAMFLDVLKTRKGTVNSKVDLKARLCGLEFEDLEEAKKAFKKI